MGKPLIEIDKTIDPVKIGEDYGTIQLRVVVMARKWDPESKLDHISDEVLNDEEAISIDSKTPLSSYMEYPKTGKMCVLFLINGQRHDGWDNTFISRDLGFKYLTKRMIIIVNLDGLKPHAIGDMIQGNRQGLYRGDVLDAVKSRMIATLKGDNDLIEIQAEAEDEISNLSSGDGAVREALNQLIQDAEGGPQGDLNLPGFNQAGAGFEMAEESAKQRAVTRSSKFAKSEEVEPYIFNECEGKTVKIKPNSEKIVQVYSYPVSEWSNIEELKVESIPETEGMKLDIRKGHDFGTLKLTFFEPDGFDSEAYPLNGEIKIVARLKDKNDLRLSRMQFQVRPVSQTLKPATPPKLFDEPTELKVVSKSPVRLFADGTVTHVKLRWNGSDYLTWGESPHWKFSLECTDNPEVDFNPGFSKPRNGRFDVLLQVPEGTDAGKKFKFKVVAHGPGDSSLSAEFQGQVGSSQAFDSKSFKTRLPDIVRRRPPYDLRYVKKSEWESVECWDSPSWSGEDAGCFREPTEGKPLTFMINEDSDLYLRYKESLISRKLDENTIQRRKTHFVTHIAFHLYKMYIALVSKRKQDELAEEKIAVPGEEAMREEINRVSETVVQLMKVTADSR